MNEERAPETEVFGVNYERYAVGRKLEKFVDAYGIQTVLEVPAHGAKAAPSLYSLAFALKHCRVTLLNGSRQSLPYYEDLGVAGQVEFLDVQDIQSTSLANDSYDFVWNFAFIPTYPDPAGLLREMARVSRKYVALFSVNRRNVGFHLHRFAHWANHIPWSHGDARFNDPHFLQRFLMQQGLRVVETGVVDCPPWPDSVGFRDIRLHKQGITSSVVDWRVPYISYLKEQRFPWWFRYVYALETLPLPLPAKYLYAHIFYTVAEKNAEENVHLSKDHG